MNMIIFLLMARIEIVDLIGVRILKLSHMDPCANVSKNDQFLCALRY